MSHAFIAYLVIVIIAACVCAGIAITIAAFERDPE
jgi:hypothetical protein